MRVVGSNSHSIVADSRACLESLETKNLFTSTPSWMGSWVDVEDTLLQDILHESILSLLSVSICDDSVYMNFIYCSALLFLYFFPWSTNLPRQSSPFDLDDSSSSSLDTLMLSSWYRLGFISKRSSNELHSLADYVIRCLAGLRKPKKRQISAEDYRKLGIHGNSRSSLLDALTIR